MGVLPSPFMCYEKEREWFGGGLLSTVSALSAHYDFPRRVTHPPLKSICMAVKFLFTSVKQSGPLELKTNFKKKKPVAFPLLTVGR